jgi:hypothetical protein
VQVHRTASHERSPRSEATKPMEEFRTRRRGKMPRVVVIFGKDT